MVVFLEFSLLDNHNVERNVKMNADDPNEVYLWKVKHSNKMLKKSYWRRCAISIHKDGYYSISITSKHYGLHRVCYYAHNAEWDIYDTSNNNEIDHIDRDKSNNHISNLREATHSQNMENNNRKGYSYSKRGKVWTAEVRKEGKTYRITCKTEEEAIATREKLKATHHTF